MKVIDFEVTLENSVNDIKKLYQIIRPDVKLEDIKYNSFKEGVINLIVHLDDAKYNEPLVIRTYSLKMKAQSKKNDNKDDEFDLSKFENRELELAALKAASDLDITVKLVATYNNGFVYKYVNGDVNSVKLYDLETAKKTAIKMARLHKIDLKELANSRPVVFKFLEEDSILDAKKTFDQKMKDSKHEEFRTVLPLFSEIQNEYERIHNLVLQKNAYGKICFCHNDLNMTNMLIDKSTKDPIFIDFEWSNTNFSMYDISYHLLCMGGLFVQYFRAEDVPDIEFIKNWLIAYYEESNLLDNIKMSTNELNDFIDNELKKVLVNMLLIRLQLITRALFFEFLFSKNAGDEIKNYCLSVYNDFLDKKDQHLKLLENLNY